MLPATMARLIGPPERALELHPLSYQFPESDDRWDANWLVVRMAIVDGPRQWSAIEPAFLTWELVELICWFREVATGGFGRGDQWDGLDPLVQFEVEGNGEPIRLRELCALEFHPQ